MKKFFSLLLMGMCTILMVNAQVEFTYEAGAELVSSYLWRGQYNGGLSFQPSVSVGYEGENTSFNFNAWGSLGASDWGFRKETEVAGVGLGDGTYFVPELDLIATFTFYNISVGFTHYYYCDGGNFFGWRPIDKWGENGYYSNSTTELMVGYDLADYMPENHSFYFNWNTMIAGNDFKVTSEGMKHNFSTYVELGYEYNLEDYDITLGAQLGIVPWSSDYYGCEHGAVKNLAVKVNKAWDLDICELDVFVQGMMDPDALGHDHESAFVKASGDEKIGCQSLNGCIGVGVWF